MSKGKNLIGIAIGIVGLVVSPVIPYYATVFANGVGQMAYNITTGKLPQPISRPSQSLRESRFYSSMVSGLDHLAQMQETEYQTYLVTERHPLAVFPPDGSQE